MDFLRVPPVLQFANRFIANSRKRHAHAPGAPTVVYFRDWINMHGRLTHNGVWIDFNPIVLGGLALKSRLHIAMHCDSYQSPQLVDIIIVIFVD